MRVVLRETDFPTVEVPARQPALPPEMFVSRLERLRAAMKREGIDFFVIYADREHYANFAWLFRIDVRFEEALAVVGRDGAPVLILGNENFGMADLCPFEVKREFFQSLSLVDQPRGGASLKDIFSKHGVSGNVATAGWKYFTSEDGDIEGCFEVPHYIVETLKKLSSKLANRTDIFMNADNGLRSVVELPQLAFYEYSASVTASALWNIMQNVQPGMSEIETASYFVDYGIVNVCHPMVSFGEKAKWGLSSPSANAAKIGDFATFAFGAEGSLSSRAAYIASSAEETPCADWMKTVAMPYFRAAYVWLAALKIGARGGEIYKAVQDVFPKEKYGWSLNPGHLIASDEWVSSMMKSGSKVAVSRGNYIQLDIIPCPSAPYMGANIEDGYFIADERTRGEIAREYPEMWARFMRRREFMSKIGFVLPDEVMPMSDIGGYYRPFLLNQKLALGIEQ